MFSLLKNVKVTCPYILIIQLFIASCIFITMTEDDYRYYVIHYKKYLHLCAVRGNMFAFIGVCQ